MPSLLSEGETRTDSKDDTDDVIRFDGLAEEHRAQDARQCGVKSRDSGGNGRGAFSHCLREQSATSSSTHAGDDGRARILPAETSR